ncbi:ribosome biogenesis factor YjgA [Marinimicrobium agarilyticum]|uniref:ribosome biogenesis factor YjgA n=1 Tax=Marinimicrobium agarilyticum TaxID=306546 RepID=UPI00042809A3|nr:ribosome biogenesis factor YjgA [Marinimicrobium agarilyticum]
MKTDNDYDFDDSEKSKTQVKKEMHALQTLGKQLSELNDDQLGRMPLEPKLHNALLEYRRLRHNEARRRQLQFIGRLMREADQEGIQKVMDQFNQQSRANVQLHHSAEQWRDRLLAEPDAVQAFIEEHTVSDIQHFRQLLRQAQKEATQNKPPAASRKLFKEIRDTLAKDIFG